MWKKKIFYSRMPKTTLYCIGFTFSCNRKTSNLHIMLVGFYKKKLLKNCKNDLKINYLEFCKYAKEDHLCFIKTLQIKFLLLPTAN